MTSFWSRPASWLTSITRSRSSAQKALVDQAVGKSTRQAMQMLAEVDPALAVPADRVRALGEGRWELKVVIDADCQRGLEQLRGLLSHTDPHMTIGQLVGRLVEERLDRHDPGRPRRGRRGAPSATHRTTRVAAQGTSPAHGQHDVDGTSIPHQDGLCSLPPRTLLRPRRLGRGPSSGFGAEAVRAAHQHHEFSSDDAARPRSRAGDQPAQPRDTITSAPKARIPARRAISAAVKREIWQRDGVRCRYVDPRTGRRCASRHLLQIDHLLPLRPGRGCGAEERAAPLLRSPPPPPWGSGIIAKASQLRCAGRSTCGIVAFQGN